jgi:hypothetical protein
MVSYTKHKVEQLKCYNNKAIVVTFTAINQYK